MIEVEELTKIFSGSTKPIYALNGVSFRCQPGEIFGLLGPNGAGKTTTLRILSTVLKPSGGHASVAGFNVAVAPQEVRKNIGFISGSTGIYDRLTPEETIHYFGRLYGMPLSKIKQRTEEIFEMFAMKDFARTLNSKLSTGMKQKVSIARTIVHDPDVLIFDEPTANLDIMVAKNVRKFIADCRERNKCIVLSTHIMGEANKLCDSVGIIHKGRLLDLGTVTDLKEKTQLDDLEDIFFFLVEQEKNKETMGDNR